MASCGLLSGLLIFVTQNVEWRSSAILLMIEYGIGVEWIQSYLPWRSGSIDDAVVNLIGIALGAVITSALSNRLLWYLDTARMNRQGNPALPN